MNGLIEWFAKNGVAANLLAIFIAIVGVMTIGTLRQEVFPEFSSDIISVRVVYPGAAPEEVEEGISQKIEEVIHGLTDVKKITSTSQENSSTVMVELNPGTDAARARRVQQADGVHGAMKMGRRWAAAAAGRTRAMG